MSPSARSPLPASLRAVAFAVLGWRMRSVVREVQNADRLAIAAELDRSSRRAERLNLNIEAALMADLARWLRAAAGEVSR